MTTRKLLTIDQWPDVDRAAFRAAYRPGDIFDGTAGPGVHLAEGSRRTIQVAYSQWLGFLAVVRPRDLDLPPHQRITPETVRLYITSQPAELKASSLATCAAGLLKSARLVAPEVDWNWLRAITSRLASRVIPEDRFDRLVPPWETLDLGFRLMDRAHKISSVSVRYQDAHYRDGLVIALLSTWPIRRRSLAALTVDRHLEFDESGITFLLHPEDTKSKRPESFRTPNPLLPYLDHYLERVRPRLAGKNDCGALWPSERCGYLTGGHLWEIVRVRTFAQFGKAMALHDFRRAAATFLAIDAPEMIGLIPGVLQHTTQEVSERHYNRGRSLEAGRRYARLIHRQRSAPA